MSLSDNNFFVVAVVVVTAVVTSVAVLVMISRRTVCACVCSTFCGSAPPGSSPCAFPHFRSSASEISAQRPKAGSYNCRGREAQDVAELSLVCAAHEELPTQPLWDR